MTREETTPGFKSTKVRKAAALTLSDHGIGRKVKSQKRKVLEYKHISEYNQAPQYNQVPEYNREIETSHGIPLRQLHGENVEIEGYRPTGSMENLEFDIVGKRVAVQWDYGVYEGVISSYSKHCRCFRICYDDGDTEWMPIPHRDVAIIPGKVESANQMFSKGVVKVEQTCPICLDLVYEISQYKTIGCPHKFCQPCWIAWVQTSSNEAFSQKNTWPSRGTDIDCPLCQRCSIHQAWMQ